MATVTFGRYTATNSLTHRLDPRAKILFLILLMVVVFLPFDVWSTSLIFMGIYLLIFIVLMIISKIKFRSLMKSLSAMRFLVLFLLVIYLFVPNSNYQYEMVRFSDSYALYWDSLYQAGYIILRLILMLCLTMILTSTTKPLDLTFALEWYMAPLKLVKFPVHIVSMMISIALRFIPTILDETDRIMKAQESRGVDFSHGGIGKKFKAVISLIIPLFISSFERSEQLADAMEARGYNPRGKRTRFHKLRFHYRDLIAFILVGGLFGFIMYMTIAHRNINILNFLFGVETLF